MVEADLERAEERAEQGEKYVKNYFEISVKCCAKASELLCLKQN